MARRRIGVADIKAVLIAWDAGERISAIERMLRYTRPTVRKYIGAAQRLVLQPHLCDRLWESCVAQPKRQGGSPHGGPADQTCIAACGALSISG